MSKSHAAILVIPAMLTLAACIDTREPVVATPVVAESQPALKVVEDLARGRRWELGWGTASVYDIATGQLVQGIRLEGAILSGARESGLPDMLLSRSGAAIVSSNAQTSLWRISPERFEVERYDIEVDSEQGKDFGFDGLTWESDERVLHATSTPAGASWRIDLASAKATKVE